MQSTTSHTTKHTTEHTTVQHHLPKALLFTMLLFSLAFPAYAQLSTNAVYVGNQGNFSDANGSVSIYSPSAGTVVTDGIENLNTLVQSITIHEDRGYIMANTSDRIDVFDVTTNTRTGQITDIASPRYLAVVDAGKAYVSNLFSSSVSVIDLSTNMAAGTVTVGSNPEDIAVIGNKAYVANNGFGFDSTLTVIDVTTDMPLQTIDLECDGPRFLEADGQDELWVFCNGKTVYNDTFTEIIEQTNGQVIILSASDEIIHRFELDAQTGASSAGQDTHYDPVTDRIFLVQDKRLLVFDTTNNSQLDSIDIPGDESIGGVAYDAASDRLFLARITSFTTAGFVSIHNANNGMEMDRFDAGITPTTLALVQTGTSVASEDNNEQPATFVVHQNYPNPFNPTTTIAFDQPKAGTVTLKIYNALGIEVATLADGFFASGTHELSWQAGNMPSGLYFYHVTSGNFTATRQMTLIK